MPGIRRAEDVAAIFAQHRDQLFDLRLHVVRRAKGQRGLHADPALKAKSVPKTSLEDRRGHSLGAELQGS